MNAMAIRLLGLGSPNGPDANAPFNGWFRYPAGFSKPALEACAEWVAPRRGSIVVDPFAGMATVGPVVLARKARFVGIEAHPLVQELANLKFTCPADPTELLDLGQAITKDLVGGRIDDEPDLVRRCFTDEALGDLVTIRTRIERRHESPWQPYLMCALLATLRDCANVRVGWPYQLPSQQRTPRYERPELPFSSRIRRMATDLASIDQTSTAGHVVLGDARRPESWNGALGGTLADGCITSPPYMNNFDYADATRLELYFLGTATSWAQLTNRIRTRMIVASTQQTTVGAARDAMNWLGQCPVVRREVGTLVARLRRERSRRPRSKEYDKLLPLYLADMGRVLVQLAQSLKPGAPTALVIGDSAPYGVYVDVPWLVGELARDCGLRVEADTAIRSRGLRWRSNGTRHQVALGERLLVLRA